MRPRSLIFIVLNVFLVGAYGYAMAGRVEPLKFRPEQNVIWPLMVITAVVSPLVYPLLRRHRSLVARALFMYFAFVLISAVYGIYLWILFPDGSPFAVLVAVIGGHLYGFPLFLAVVLTHLALGRLLFPKPHPSAE